MPADASSDPWFQSLFADRIGGANYGKGTEIYKFEKIKRAKRKALAEHPERKLLDFGIGENDDMAGPVVREALKREVDKVENRGYADNGIQNYKDAAAEFMLRQFGVKLDPVTEISHCIGSKPAYAMLPMCFINPGDVTLMTVPGYPVAGTHTKYLGGEVHHLPLLEKNGFFPDLDGIPADIKQRAKLLVINYPNSPTGAVATRDFYKRVIEFAHKHQVVVVQDAAHILLTYQGDPLSFLQIDGAKEVGVEVHSMSKGFNMIGWRLGWVCGHPTIVQAYADVKDNSDSGQFMAIQHAAATALRHAGDPEGSLRQVPPPAHQAGQRPAKGRLRLPHAGRQLFPVCEGPDRRRWPRLQVAEDVSQFLITEQSVCCVPWDDAGAYLRFSATYIAKDEAEEDALMAETVERLGRLGLRF